MNRPRKGGREGGKKAREVGVKEGIEQNEKKKKQKDLGWLTYSEQSWIASLAFLGSFYHHIYPACSLPPYSLLDALPSTALSTPLPL